ncbi:hypothetical protein [Clostridium tyrobutyricum]|uniref:XkdQ/YqbQ family protein n=1 Tax=Clostridium tyrobutyricum TaxID=1519 RepID=UPI002B21782E|nr:hypothetical protein [Clostridium tyrobutyricum]MEA5008219.1 hypothetical protein [Clostridium tyrobutyricum]
MTALSVWAKYYSSGLKKYLTQDLTDMLKTVASSCDKSSVARKFDITYAYPITDNNQPKLQVAPGTFITVYLDYKAVWYGFVHTREMNTQEQTVTFTAYDCLIYLIKSKVTYNFKKATAESCVEKICSDLGVRYNRIPTTKIPVTLLIKDQTAYEAIMQIYYEVSKSNGKKYIMYADNNQLSVMEKGTIIEDSVSVPEQRGMWTRYHALDPKENMSGTVYKDTIENMINRVKAYDDNGKFLGMVESSSNQKFYGTFQSTYTKEENKNWKTEATNLLHGVDREITVDAIGDWRFRTGYAAFINASYIDALDKKIFYIDGDTHTWNLESGLYTMELNLNSQNTMDALEVS